MKIGIITYFHPINYGAFLQSYALSSRLNQIEGVTAEVLNFRYPIEDRWYSKKTIKYLKKSRLNFSKIRFDVQLNKAFDRDWKKLSTSKEEIVSDDIELFVDKYSSNYDIMIAGSDEIWKATGYRGFPTVYWLPGQLNCKKLSYAASARVDFSKLSLEKQKLVREYLNEFQVIGVRDENTEVAVKRFTDHPERVRRCCDPVFIYDFKPNRELGRKLLSERFKVDASKPLIGLMASSPKIAEELKKLCKKKSFEIVSLYEFTSGFKNAADISPLEWVNVIAGLDFLVTRFFHATSFAIIGGTPFLSIDTHTKNKSDSKILDMLSHFGLDGRCIDNVDELLKDSFLEKSIERAIRNGREDNFEQIQKFRNSFDGYLKIAEII